MTSLLRLQSNRQNALKSTGPRTPRGKLASSRNAVRHGINSSLPVLRPRETRAAWEKFAAAVMSDLQPHGVVEAMWAGRIALLMWRLRRASDARRILADQQWREVETQAPRSTWWLHRTATEDQFPATLVSARKETTRLKKLRKLLDQAAAASAAPTPPEISTGHCEVQGPHTTDLIAWAVAHLSLEDRFEETFLHKNCYPSIGPLTKQPDPAQYFWTVDQLREALAQVAALNGEKLDDLLQTLVPALKKAYNIARARLRRAQREIRRQRLCSDAQSMQTAQPFDRYEVQIECSLARSLAQLKIIQSQRVALSSPNEATASQNRVQMGFVSVQLPENS